MKTLNRSIATFVLLLALAVAVGLLPSHGRSANPAGVNNGSLQNYGYGTVGSGSVTFSTSGPLCLSGGSQAQGASIPCALVWLQATAGTVNTMQVSVSTGTASAGLLLATTATTGYIAVPCSDVNQLWVSSPTAGTAGACSYLYFRP